MSHRSSTRNANGKNTELHCGRGESMIDSRERNSADGSLVQKARRQVEVFQSQGNGGRSFQVVRASQWASSRAIDSAFELGPNNNKSNLSGGSELVGNGLSPRLSSLMWRASLNEQASDLERLSSICRQLHEEAMSQHSRLWEDAAPLGAPEAPAIAAERRSNSSEDLSGLADSFARDCRTRRSLQIGEDEAKSRRAEPANGFSIAENNFVKNDPKHPSKIGHAKISVQDTGVAATQNGHAPSPAVARKTNNKTVVHLRNAASPTAVAERRVSLIKLDNEPLEAATGGDEPQHQPSGAKPVKRVEFCKTEIHFAPDSGKVNIVETDGKPPPTNKFRRRRRRDSVGAAVATPQKSSMPLVHFGDTSYEKYIFGGQAKPPPPPPPAERNKTGADEPMMEDSGAGFGPGPNEPEKKERWEGAGTAAPPASAERKITREDSIVAAAPGKEAPTDANLERPDHKSRGTHTTTVNFLSDEALRKQPPGEDRAAYPLSGVARKDVGIQSDLPAVETAEPGAPVQLRIGRAQQDNEQPAVEQPDAQAKDLCDSSSQTSEQTPRDPTYENIFDASTSGGGGGGGGLLYENFHVVQAKGEPGKRRPSSGGSRKLANGPNKPASCRSNGSSSARSDRSAPPPSPTPKRRSPGKLGSRDSSVKRFKDITDAKLVEDGNARNRIACPDPAGQRSHRPAANNNSTDKSSGSARSKKPVEVVYQTAVYNMKNEKLSKPTRGKDSKGPRLINDLICGGSKIKRPADKRVAKTAIMSQNTSKRKETPTATSR